VSSKRHMRRKACDGKRRHANHAEAVAHIASLYRSGRKTGGEMGAYHCHFCKGWHVGHTPAHIDKRPRPGLHGRRP